MLYIIVNASLCAVSLMRFVSGRVHGTSVPQMAERLYSSAERLFTLRSDVRHCVFLAGHEVLQRPQKQQLWSESVPDV